MFRWLWAVTIHILCGMRTRLLRRHEDSWDSAYGLSAAQNPQAGAGRNERLLDCINNPYSKTVSDKNTRIFWFWDPYVQECILISFMERQVSVYLLGGWENRTWLCEGSPWNEQKNVLLMLLESLSHSVSHSKYLPIALTQSKRGLFSAALYREEFCFHHRSALCGLKQ